MIVLGSDGIAGAIACIGMVTVLMAKGAWAQDQLTTNAGASIVDSNCAQFCANSGLGICVKTVTGTGIMDSLISLTDLSLFYRCSMLFSHCVHMFSLFSSDRKCARLLLHTGYHCVVCVHGQRAVVQQRQWVGL